MRILFRRAALAATIGVLGLGAARAQPAPERLRGRIAGVEGDLLRIATLDGGQAVARLGEAPVSALRRVPIGDLAAGTNLGVVAIAEADGLRAIAVTVLPATATRQFQSPWDLGPDSSMNNGAVAGVMQGAQASELTLSINGRAVPIRVDDRTAIVQPIPATRADLKPGAAVFVFGSRGADGVVAATRVTVEKDGVAPPT
jgi:hypothetical protein